MKFKIKRDFFFDLYEAQKIPEPFLNIAFFKSNHSNSLKQLHFKEFINNKFYSIKSVPEYFKVDYNRHFYSALKIPQYHKGYSILLDKSFNTIDEYLKLQFKSKAKTIRRYVRRLEASYDITYKMYYGKISEVEYDYLFGVLKNMLKVRFEEKKEINERLLEWQRLHNFFLKLILSKKASIYVIYDAKIPIAISLNYNFDKLLFSSISSYDINYSKFGLGHIDIYKQLEWCLNNEYDLYEMGRGDWDYKRRWSNFIYHLDHYVVIPNKTNRVVRMLAKKEFLLIGFYEFLRSKKINIVYNNFKKLCNNVFRFKKTELNKYMFYPLENLNIIKNVKEVNLLDKKNEHLIRPLNDFLYTFNEHKNHATIHQFINKKNEYILKGLNNNQKLIFDKIHK